VFSAQASSSEQNDSVKLDIKIRFIGTIVWQTEALIAMVYDVAAM
jgi:hypothetical protein